MNSIISAVFIFGAISSLFEFVLLMKLKPRTRLRVLGSSFWVAMLHTFIILANLAVHYGTLTGSMTAIVAGLSSFLVIPFTRWLCGHIERGIYFSGLLQYKPHELA